MFKALAPQRAAERLARAIGARRFDENKGGGAKQLLFKRGSRIGPLPVGHAGFKPTQKLLDTSLPGRRGSRVT